MTSQCKRGVLAQEGIVCADRARLYVQVSGSVADQTAQAPVIGWRAEE